MIPARSFALITILSATALVPPAVAQQAPDDSIYRAILAEPEEDTPNISFEAMAQILAEGSAAVFDVRSFNEYVVGHIPGALFVGQKPGSTREAYASDPVEIAAAVGNDRSARIVLYCNGPFCGKSKRVAEDLLAKGYANVVRFQLGDPVWRALGGAMEADLEGVEQIFELDGTASFVDSRERADFLAGTIRGAISIPASMVEDGKGGQEVKDAKEDGRLPMGDHTTRIVVFGDDPAAIERVASAIRMNAFSHVLNSSALFSELGPVLDTVQQILTD